MTIKSAVVSASVPGMFDLAPGNLAGLLIDTKQHGAFCPVMLGQYPRQCGTRFFGFVFMITGNEDDVLALQITRLATHTPADRRQHLWFEARQQRHDKNGQEKW